jgi:hypothetical protein
MQLPGRNWLMHSRELEAYFNTAYILFEICSLLGYYAACSGKSLPKFRDKLSVRLPRAKKSTFLTLEDGPDRLFRNVCKLHRIAHISFTSRQRLEIMHAH